MGARHRATIDELAGSWPDPDVRAWSQAIVDPALRAAVDGLPGSMRHIAGYHLGWWDEDGRPALADDADTARSTLVLLGAAGVGGTPAGALPAAVAVDLAHHFTVLHDDVIEGRVTRRERPAAWVVFGLRAAILAGDALLATALEALAASGNPCAETGMRALTAAVLEIVDAQSADLVPHPGPRERVSIAGGRAAPLLGCACALGAAFGGGSAYQREHLAGYGENVGLACQLGPPAADDLLVEAVRHLQSAALTAEAAAALSALVRAAAGWTPAG